jgi:hypothetical protein
MLLANHSPLHQSQAMFAGLAIWAAVTGTVSLLMAFARTPPGEAASNLSKWLEWLGVRHIPSWLRTRAADRWVLRYGALMVAILLFLGGMGLDSWLRSPVAAVIDPRVNALQSELVKLKKELAEAGQSKDPAVPDRIQAGSAPQNALRPRRYTAYEKEQRIRAIDEIYDVFAVKLTSAYTNGRDLFNNLKAEVENGTAPQRIKEQYQKTEAAFNALKALLQKYEYLPDVIEVATKNTYNGLTLMVACDNMISELAYLAGISQNSVVAYLDRDIVVFEARTSIRDFETYLNDTKPRLKQKRAEYEAADIVGSTEK